MRNTCDFKEMSENWKTKVKYSTGVNMRGLVT